MKVQYNNNNYRGKLTYVILVISFFVFSCEDLDKLNVDPTKNTPASFNANFFLSNSQNNYLQATTGYSGPILFQSGWVQILASTTTLGANYYSNMDKYVPSTNTANYQQGGWNNAYRSASLANQILVDTEGKTGFVNLRAVAKIMIILNLQHITDVYGDAPYNEAFQALIGNTRPVYESQDALYKTLLSDLDKAVGSLITTGPTADAITSDLIYKGDIAKWKKFGNSLMLRMAMRLIKADPATAKTYAEKAAAGGTFENIADDAKILGENNYRNGNAGPLGTASDLYEVRWSKTIIDFLKGKNDPRLSIIAEVPAAGLAANNSAAAGDNTAEKQMGLPNGFDMADGATDITKSPGYPGSTGSGSDVTKIGKYSRPTGIYRNTAAPTFIITYAETELLLAEAKVRGFSVSGTALEHYANGVKGAMEGLAPFGPSAVVTTAAASAYAAANPLDVSSTANSLKMINEQYWATTGVFFNFVEAWNNWKRSGFPALIPVNFTGNFSGGTIPRRQPYPTGEAGTNGDAYRSAVSKLTGGDVWTARTWWDK